MRTCPRLLRWGCDAGVANRVSRSCEAEDAGFFASATDFVALERESPQPSTFYDSLSGEALFVVPPDDRNAFLEASEAAGRLCFREAHVANASHLVFGRGRTRMIQLYFNFMF